MATPTIRPSILWLRRDLRLHDLPALLAAADHGGEVVPLFVLDDRLLGGSPVRAAALLDALGAAQESYDGAILLRRGDPAQIVPDLARQIDAAAVHISAENTPFGRRRDAAVRAALPDGVQLVATGSPYAIGPGTIRTGAGTGSASAARSAGSAARGARLRAAPRAPATAISISSAVGAAGTSQRGTVIIGTPARR
jgi:deoxyribodipyrimidine photolyase